LWDELPNPDVYDCSIAVWSSAQRGALGSGLSAVRGSGYRLVADPDVGSAADSCAMAGECNVRPGKLGSCSDCDESRCTRCDGCCVRCYVECRVGRCGGGKNSTNVTPSTSSGQALNEVKGLLTLVESASRRSFATLRMTQRASLNSPAVPRSSATDALRYNPHLPILA